MKAQNGSLLGVFMIIGASGHRQHASKVIF